MNLVLGTPGMPGHFVAAGLLRLSIDADLTNLYTSCEMVFRNIAVSAFASLGSHGINLQNAERDFHR